MFDNPIQTLGPEIEMRKGCDDWLMNVKLFRDKTSKWVEQISNFRTLSWHLHPGSWRRIILGTWIFKMEIKMDC
jgi:hypothetical protein